MTVFVVGKITMWSKYHSDPSFWGPAMEPDTLAHMRASHECHKGVMGDTIEALHQAKVGLTLVDWNDGHLQMDPKPGDTIIAVGGDGTFLTASHYATQGVGILGINSDPARSRGRFCTQLPEAQHAAAFFKRAAAHQAKKTWVPRMEVLIDGDLRMPNILNEVLLCHENPAAMTRLLLNGEKFSCSGIWVGTGAGSTGAIRSAGGRVHALTHPSLQAIVREPCETKQRGHIGYHGDSFEAVCKTTHMCLYADGAFMKQEVRFDSVLQFRRSELLLMLGPVPK